MPSPVAAAFTAAGLVPEGVVPWGTAVPRRGPGVYVVALTERTDTLAGARPSCPLAPGALERLLAVRPELQVDGVRPDRAALARRLAALWLPDEVIVYIGLAGRIN